MLKFNDFSLNFLKATKFIRKFVNFLISNWDFWHFFVLELMILKRMWRFVNECFDYVQGKFRMGCNSRIDGILLWYYLRIKFVRFEAYACILNKKHCEPETVMECESNYCISRPIYLKLIMNIALKHGRKWTYIFFS